MVTGVSGQDGTYLSEYLLQNGYSVVGVDIRKSSVKNVEMVTDIDLSDKDAVFEFVGNNNFGEIYCLAAYHGSSQDKISDDLETFKRSYEINVLHVANLLEAVKKYSANTKIFYAASSQMFGEPDKPMQDEKTALNPNNIYGITKATATKLCDYYRNKHNIFASVGILYAHESPLRTPNFVSKKIVKTAVEIKRKQKDKLVLGSLDSQADWGYAGDYVVAMSKILQHERADDFIISSGKTHTVKDFVRIVFDCLEMDWEQYVEEDKSLFPNSLRFSISGDNKKIKSRTGWHPTVDFKGLVQLLVKAELQEN